MTHRALSSPLSQAKTIDFQSITPAMSEESFPSSSSYPGSAFRALVSHFESNEFLFHSDSAKQTVQLFITGESAVYSCRLQISHGEELLQVRVAYPVSARDAKIRPLVAEMISRANHGLLLGGFEIDMDTGEIEYSVGQVIHGPGLDDDLISRVFTSSLATADRYFPALMRVMFAGYTPTDAVFLSELDVQAESVEDEPPVQSPAAMTPKPPAKKPRAPHKDPRLESTRELPGLFDQKPDDRDGHSGRL